MERTIESLEQDLKSEHDQYLRALADFDNYRRRIERERDRFGKEALRAFILPILEVADDFERSLNFPQNETSPLADGVRAIYQKLMNVLQAAGVRPFESIGRPFDPSQHE